MRLFKLLLKIIGALLSIPILYLIIALIFSYIPVGTDDAFEKSEKVVYISSNGVHLDIIVPKKYLSEELRTGLRYRKNDQLLAFGWGSRDFYLNTPEWSDLTLTSAFSALFLNNETLMHVKRYRKTRTHWKKIIISDVQLEKLNNYIHQSFLLNENGEKTILSGQGYSAYDDFYEGKGNYHCFKTCNTWVNSALKSSDQKACLWTPFDFGVLNLYD